MLHRYITDVLSSSVQHRSLYHDIFGCDVMFLRWWRSACQRKRRGVPKNADVICVFTVLTSSSPRSYHRLYFAECIKELQSNDVIKGSSNYQRNGSKSSFSPCRNVRSVSTDSLASACRHDKREPRKSACTSSWGVLSNMSLRCCT
jgi:hypothetical protein